MSIIKFHHVWSTSRSPIYVLLRRRGMEGFLSTFIYTFRYICKSSCQLIRGSCFTGKKGALTIHYKIHVNYYFDLLFIIVQAHSIFFARPTPNILTSEKENYNMNFANLQNDLLKCVCGGGALLSHMLLALIYVSID